MFSTNIRISRQSSEKSPEYGNWIYIKTSISNHESKNEPLNKWWLDNWIAICKMKN